METSRRGLIGGATSAATLLTVLRTAAQGKSTVTDEEIDNKVIVGRWFTEFWGEKCNLAVVDEIAAPDMFLKYSLHAPRHGRDHDSGPRQRTGRCHPLRGP